MPKKGSRQLYHKLFFTYSIIIVCIVSALMFYFIFTTRMRILETNLNYSRLMEEKAVSYLEEAKRAVDNINHDLYQTTNVMEDLIRYFELSEEEYQRYRLNTFMESPSLSYTGFDRFVEKMMQANPDITEISFYCYQKRERTICDPDGTISKQKEARNYTKKLENGDLAGKEEFAFLKEIRDPRDLKSVGCMIVSFRAAPFQTIKDGYDQPELYVVNELGSVIFRSDPHVSPVKLKEAQENGTLEKYLNAYLEKAKIGDYSVFSYLNKKKASNLPFSTLCAILLIAAGCVLLGESLVYFHLKHLTDRLSYILEGMNQVTTGDLSGRLRADENGDELDLISEKFNEMCGKLNRYIEKSYLAEIEQKNAEMEVLQNQINPHFLYNTLEAIRMKAILNGDRTVGKMLYSMAVIFRSQLKDADIIPLIQEIHYCKKYLELFEYRYEGMFTSTVECPEEIMKCPVIKFMLQPVIENYFVHGIRSEDNDNYIHIYAEKKEDALWIHIKDNGKGMDQQTLDLKNEEFQKNAYDSKKSIGLLNVNRRIKAYYGSEYGVTLTDGGNGLHVRIKIGLGEEIDEKGNDSRG